MNIEYFLHEMSTGGRIKILKMVSRGLNKKRDIMKDIDCSNSTTEASLSFLVKNGLLQKNVVRRKFYNWKISYELTEKGERILQLIEKIEKVTEPKHLNISKRKGYYEKV